MSIKSRFYRELKNWKIGKIIKVLSQGKVKNKKFLRLKLGCFKKF